MLPSDMLEHIYGLLPDPAVIYEVVFLDLLPPAARNAALSHSSLADMAAAADKIVLEGSTGSPSTSVSQVSEATAALALDEVSAVTSRTRPSRGRDARPPRALRFLCSTHARWGRNAFRCADPVSYTH